MNLRTLLLSGALTASLLLCGDAAQADQPAPDNTRTNQRDRPGSPSLTPMDQGGSRSETRITAAIRRQLVRAKGLSFDARNAKVITVGDRVTLRGPVRDARERTRLEQLARKTAGVADVDNQLEARN